MIKRVGKKGDTLVEVMLAVGIFSMVAVAVVAVMSSGTSSSQVALETTLTREEIDTQAEALRFIHSAYITAREADPEGGESSPYAKLWHAITDKAIDFTDEARWNDEQEKEAILQYSPSDCSALYSNDDAQARAHGFIINTRALSGFDSLDPSNETDINNAISEIIVTGQAKENIIEGAEITTAHFLTPTTTYPRLIFRNNLSNTDNTNLLSGNSFDALYRAEGIYIVAVKDPISTTLYNKDEKQLETDTAAYFDFYIRSCWYGTGDQTPSSISTVMRLYDPEVIEYDPVIIDAPEVASCGADENMRYIMVDANIQIGDSNIQQSGVEGISIETYYVKSEGESESKTQVNSNDRDMKCFFYSDLLNKGEEELSKYEYRFGEFSNGEPFAYSSSSMCPSGTPWGESTRLKVRQGYSGWSNEGGAWSGGDFWYPVSLDQKVNMVISSDKYTLYFDSNDVNIVEEDQDLKDNPYICVRRGVSCKFSSGVKEDYELTDMSYTPLSPTIINDGQYHRLEVTFTVGCTSANQVIRNPSGNIPDGLQGFESNVRSISVNTSWR